MVGARPGRYQFIRGIDLPVTKFRTLRKCNIAVHYMREKPPDCNSPDTGHSLPSLAGID